MPASGFFAPSSTSSDLDANDKLGSRLSSWLRVKSATWGTINISYESTAKVELGKAGKNSWQSPTLAKFF